jgi:dynamin 1-like protein
MNVINILGDPDFKPYAIFPQEGDQKYFDFGKVYEKINEMTDKVCGKEKGIVDQPITMKVYSQTAPDLTLIDLPGITRIAIGGQ